MKSVLMLTRPFLVICIKINPLKSECVLFLLTGFSSDTHTHTHQLQNGGGN